MRKAIPTMLLVATLLAALLAADPPKPAEPPAQEPKAEEKVELPKYYSTYGEERSVMIMNTCIQAGAGRFTEESIKNFCVCHVYILEEVVPFPELQKMPKDERRDLFSEVSRGCASLGAVPVPLPPKAKPPPKPGEVEI